MENRRRGSSRTGNLCGAHLSRFNGILPEGQQAIERNGQVRSHPSGLGLSRK